MPKIMSSLTTTQRAQPAETPRIRNLPAVRVSRIASMSGLRVLVPIKRVIDYAVRSAP